MSLINGDEPSLWMFSAVLPRDLCAVIRREASELEAAPGVVGAPTPGVTRRAEVAFFPPGHWVQGLIDKYAWEANALAGWHYTLHGTEPVQWSAYEPGGEYGWHVDTFAHEGTTRKLSVLVQLTDRTAFEGGTLQIRRHGTAEPETLVLPEGHDALGTILVFPSFLLHRVTAVDAGRRESLAAWVRGPRFT